MIRLLQLRSVLGFPSLKHCSRREEAMSAACVEPNTEHIARQNHGGRHQPCGDYLCTVALGLWVAFCLFAHQRRAGAASWLAHLNRLITHRFMLRLRMRPIVLKRVLYSMHRITVQYPVGKRLRTL